MTDRTGVLVVGGSGAGLRTAEALRRNGYAGTITLLEAGRDLPYDRTALSKKLLEAGRAAATVLLRAQEDLDKAGIQVRLRSEAASLDTSRRSVRLADGTAIEYSHLVLATGARARELPRPAVHYLRTLDDARRLRDRIKSARAAVVLDDGMTLAADLVVAGVGALPNTDWLAGSGIAVNDGVVCDGFCRTTAPGVYAAGDVARWPNALFEVHIVDDDGAGPVLVALYAREGRLTGAFALNAPSHLLALRRALAARTPLHQVLEKTVVRAGNGARPGGALQHPAYKML